MTAITETENIYLILFSGVFYMFWKNPTIFRHSKKRLIIFPSLLLGTSQGETLKDILFYFTKAGAFVFGSGLAIVPFLHTGVVQEYKWLTERQFLDAVAVAMISPGPVVITVAFIGYIVAGMGGATVAALATFLPCYLFTIIPAPYFNKYAKNLYLKSLVLGITCAAVGAIAGACWVLGKRAVVDPYTLIIAIASAGAIYRFKFKEVTIIFVTAFVGLAWWLLQRT
ncbi:MAG: chromate efflux transporter, partial [Bdellovibrionales bacterium]|nr:chromate efflux transporter [Bdellovibrionales bacterium]